MVSPNETLDGMTLSVDPAELSVDIGLPTGPLIPWQTSLSLAKTVKYCTERGIAVGVACIAGSSVVTWARTKVLDTFLQGKARHLFWIDSDIQWEPEQFLRLLALNTQYPVVCATYPQKTDEQTIVIRRQNLEHFEINPHGLIKVEGAGLGFTVITREVAERISAAKPFVFDPVEQRRIRDVFRLDTVDRGREHPDIRHEDMAFFADLLELGYDIHLDLTIQLGHVGPKVYRADPLVALRLEDALRGAQDGHHHVPSPDVS